jgi:hypothetical protein
MHLPREGAKYAEMPDKADRAAIKAAADRARSAAAKRLPKLALAVASGSHVILAARARIGHGSDAPDFAPLMYDAWRRAGVKAVVADAGYDSEPNHRLARLDMGVRSVIPPKVGRKTEKPPTARFRRLMKQRFARRADKALYGQRAQSETVNSMFKRNFGEALRSVRRERRVQEMLLRALAHNVLLKAGQS